MAPFSCLFLPNLNAKSGKELVIFRKLEKRISTGQGPAGGTHPTMDIRTFFSEIAEVSWYLKVVRSQGDLSAPLWELLTSVLWIPHFSAWCSEYLSFSRKSPCLIESAAREALEDLFETQIHRARLPT